MVVCQNYGSLGPERRTPMAFEKASWNRGSASEVGRTLGAVLRTVFEGTQRQCLTLEHLGLTAAQLPKTREPPQENPCQMSDTTHGPHKRLITVRQG